MMLGYASFALRLTTLVLLRAPNIRSIGHRKRPMLASIDDTANGSDVRRWSTVCEHRRSSASGLSGRDLRDTEAADATLQGIEDGTFHEENVAKRAFLQKLSEDPQLLISTAGSSFQGHVVEAYLGTISTDGVVGSSFPTAVDATGADLAGTRSLELADKMGRAKRIAWDELLWRAHELGADGVLGVRYDVYVPHVGAFGASVTATAVRFAR